MFREDFPELLPFLFVPFVKNPFSRKKTKKQIHHTTQEAVSVGIIGQKTRIKQMSLSNSIYIYKEPYKSNKSKTWPVFSSKTSINSTTKVKPIKPLGVHDSFETNHHANPWRELSRPQWMETEISNPQKTMARFF